jgi:hypothetical protein
MEKDFLAPKAKKNDSMIFFTLPSIIGMSNLAADLAKHDLAYGAIWEGVIDGIGHMLKVFYPNFIRLHLRPVRRFILKIDTQREGGGKKFS